MTYWQIAFAVLIPLGAYIFSRLGYELGFARGYQLRVKHESFPFTRTKCAEDWKVRR